MNGSNKFLGMVRSIQNGLRPIAGASDSVRKAVHKILPVDPHMKKLTKSSSTRFLMTHYLTKAANVESALHKAEQAVKSIQHDAHQRVAKEKEQLLKENEKLKQEGEKMKQEVAKAKAESSEGGALPITPPNQPAAQPLYGQQAVMQQAQLKAMENGDDKTPQQALKLPGQPSSAIIRPPS